MKITAAFLFFFCSIQLLRAQTPAGQKGTVQIQYTAGHPANILKPAEMLGAAFDGHEQGEIDDILRSENIQAMKTVGLHPLSYRLRTELGVEAWHWNPTGTWSEAGRKEGYWTSSASSTQPIQLSNGYRLPRRGNTHDQANDDGYSRIDDGDTTAFWKSNPYLDEYYTKESNTLHPQWVVIDLGKLVPVNAVRIQWGNPYALYFQADYALDIGDDYFDPLQPGLWHPFTKGNVSNQKGGNDIVLISDQPVMVRFVRISMTRGSATAAEDSKDIRDKLGFAIKEIEAGLLHDKGKFHDAVKHAANKKRQSVIHVSSTDPWHRAEDIDIHTEQAGIDRFFTCGLTGNEPTMIPLGLLYDTPDNMLALVQYLLAKKYPVKELEMGEEPEGQLVDPQDYAALYCQLASGIKKLSPGLRMGGPCFAALSTSVDDNDSFSESQWTKQFLSYLKMHNSLGNYNFFSFEWYPFDDICAPTAPQLAEEPELLNTALKNFSNEVLPPGTPLYATEYGYSAHSGRAEVEIEAALMYADILGQFLTLGGNKSFLYGYEPTYLDQYHGCDWGNNMLFGLGENGKIAYRTAAYYGMRMLTQQWVQPGDSLLEIYPASADIKNKEGQALVTSYAVRRPNNQWSIVLINKDQQKSWDMEISILDISKKTAAGLHFPLKATQYSSLQYQWKSKGRDGYPSRSLPPEEKTIPAGKLISLPPYSLTVITENNR